MAHRGYRTFLLDIFLDYNGLTLMHGMLLGALSIIVGAPNIT